MLIKFGAGDRVVRMNIEHDANNHYDDVNANDQHHHENAIEQNRHENDTDLSSSEESDNDTNAEETTIIVPGHETCCRFFDQSELNELSGKCIAVHFRQSCHPL